MSERCGTRTGSLGGGGSQGDRARVNPSSALIVWRLIAIAAGILVMTLGAPVFAASQPAQPAGGSASMNASGGSVPVNADINGKSQGNNNGQGKGGNRRLELPRTWFHHALGSVGSVLKGAVITAGAM